MDAIGFVVGFIIGLVLGLAGALWLRRREADLALRVAMQAGTDKLAEIDRLTTQVRDAFGALSREALAQNTREFLQLAGDRLQQESIAGAERLEVKKVLIDTHLQKVSTELDKLNALVHSVELSRQKAQGELGERIQGAMSVTERLRDTTAALHRALSNPQQRGQWGERMADDVLRVAGFEEGISFTRQSPTESGSRPDFTFPLPGDLKIHMDVKFPLTNYLKYLETTEQDPQRYELLKRFLQDVRGRVKEVTTREYINPAAGTADCVLLFIPNEQVYGFIHEHDASLLDDALRLKVILCSPTTLFAVLAVIRRAVENFRLRKASDEILELLVRFRGEWNKYSETVDTLGKRLDAAMRGFQDLTGTRTRTLEKHMARIDDLQQARGVVLPEVVDGPVQ